MTRSSAPSPIQLTSRSRMRSIRNASRGPTTTRRLAASSSRHRAARRRRCRILALADGEMNDALMAADHMAVEIDDVAGLDRVRLQAADDSV